MTQAGDRGRLEGLLAEIRACRACVEAPLRAPLPHEPRPVLHVSSTSRILVASQAPGTKVHLSGRSFTDASGDRLRDWMGVDAEVFYDEAQVAIVAMGFCFPGQDANGSDLPPRRECAALWHDRLFAARPGFDLIVAVGRAAQAYHMKRLGLSGLMRPGLTETVQTGEKSAPPCRTRGSIRCPILHGATPAGCGAHPWFEAELLPELRADIAASLDRARRVCEGRPDKNRETA